jgi:hypothetical protein
MNHFKIILALITFFIISACTVRTTQLDALRSMGNQEELLSAEGFFWNAQINERESAEVLAINMDDHTAFASRDGWIMRFNGWEIYELNIPTLSLVIHMNFSQTNVTSEGSHSSQMQCEPWSNTEIDIGVRHHRLCMVAGVTYEGFLIVNSLGETIEIHQYISEAFGYLNLTKL